MDSIDWYHGLQFVCSAADGRLIHVTDWDTTRKGYLWGKETIVFNGTQADLKAELLDLLNTLPDINSIGWPKNCVDILSLGSDYAFDGVTKSCLVFICASKKPDLI